MRRSGKDSLEIAAIIANARKLGKKEIYRRLEVVAKAEGKTLDEYLDERLEIA